MFGWVKRSRYTRDTQRVEEFLAKKKRQFRNYVELGRTFPDSAQVLLTRDYHEIGTLVKHYATNGRHDLAAALAEEYRRWVDLWIDRPDVIKRRCNEIVWEELENACT